MAAEILACADENRHRMQLETRVITDQTVVGVRAVSTYFTFYKAVIPTAYWKELEVGLPTKQSIVFKRWPGDDRPTTGLDIAKPEARREMLIAFSKIRQFLLQYNQL